MTTITLEMYHVLIIILALVGAAWAGWIFFFAQFEKRMDEKMKAGGDALAEVHRLELAAAEFKYHVAETYVKHDALEAFRREMRDMFDKMNGRLDEMVRAA